MMDNKTYTYYNVNRSETRAISTSPTGECKELCMVILPIVVGLPILSCLLAMGGVFAYVGPWVMFGVAIHYSKRLEKGVSPSALKHKRSVRGFHAPHAHSYPARIHSRANNRIDS